MQRTEVRQSQRERICCVIVAEVAQAQRSFDHVDDLRFVGAACAHQRLFDGHGAIAVHRNICTCTSKQNDAKGLAHFERGARLASQKLFFDGNRLGRKFRNQGRSGIKQNEQALAHVLFGGGNDGLMMKADGLAGVAFDNAKTEVGKAWINAQNPQMLAQKAPAPLLPQPVEPSPAGAAAPSVRKE